MEPETRYTRTTDGINIAYCTLGSGPPLVYLPPMPRHLQFDWRNAGMRELYLWLARHHQFVRFDGRGRGLSQREVSDLSPPADVLDMEAVVTRLDLERFALFAHGMSVDLAVRYAVAHPAQVQKLVLVSPFAPYEETIAEPRIQAMMASLALDYYTWSEATAYIIAGWQGGENTRSQAALMREAMTHEQAVRYFARTRREDRAEFARCVPLVEAPTLIVYQSEAVAVPASSPQRLAAEIADARLVRLEGTAVGGADNDPLMMAAVDEFLLGSAGDAVASASLPAGTAAILFVDIESSTALTELMGDAAFRSASRDIDTHIREVVRAAGGTPVDGKVMGDGVMSVFPSAAQAIAGARACRDLSASSELRLHIGLHAGDVIREDNNVYGGAVNIASRVCDASTAGEILVSATVRDLARTSASVIFEDRGERALKGIEDPVRVFAVLPRE
jgi:class 3 adenylate cyclase